jgi:radical SAM protein with 4Fe4S-binding SPASM domain
MNGLTAVNIELTSRCNKSCWMCGRRKVDKDFPKIKAEYGDIDFDLVKRIAGLVPEGIMVQFHWNGEPLLYDNLGMALGLFKNNIRCLDTNGKRLLKKADELIDNLDVITISVIQDDEKTETSYQKYNIREFIKLKGKRKPRIVYRCLGDVNTKWYEKHQGMVVTRTLHKPMGSFDYEKKVTIPETGICQEVLTKLAIDRYGNVSPCVRFDPEHNNIIGNVKLSPLEEIWNSPKRQKLVQMHIDGKRDEIEFCKQCDYWGVPIG